MKKRNPRKGRREPGHHKPKATKPKSIDAKLTTTTLETTPGTVTPTAPLLAVDVVAALDATAVVAAAALVVARKEGWAAGVLEAAAGVTTAWDCVPWEIWPRTVELKVPVMPLMVNLAENAVKGSVGVAGSLYANDVYLIK